MNLSSKSLLMCVLVLLFASCDKLGIGKVKEPEKASTRPELNSSYSVLWAINTQTTVDTGIDFGMGAVQVDFGTAVASFVDAGKNVSVGAVKVNDTQLKMESNNIYLSPVLQTNPTGITLEGNVKWTVEGGNGFTAMNYTTSKKIPTVTGLTADANVDRSASYTVSITSVYSADSIFYGVNDVHKVVAGNVKSVTFTAAELSKLKKGSAFVQVAPFNYEMKKNGSKVVVYGNQAVTSKLVTIK